MAKTEKPTQKRQQISQAGRTMFIAVAVAAIVFGIGASVSFHLFKKISFNNTVIGDLKQTKKTAESNLSSARELENQVKDLALKEELTKNLLKPDQDPLAVVYDAMPINGNSAAFGSSLDKLISSSGVNVESISVSLTQDDADSNSEVSLEEDMMEGEATEMAGKPSGFSFKTAGTLDGLKKMMTNLELSIRPIHVDQLVLEYSADTNWLQVTGHSFFEHKVNIEKGNKEITSEDTTRSN